MNVRLPLVFGIQQTHELGVIRQVASPETTIEATTANYKAPRTQGIVVLPDNSNFPRILIVENRPRVRADFTHIIRATPSQLRVRDGIIDLCSAKWLAHPEASSSKAENEERLQTIVNSWPNAFAYSTEDVDNGIRGLRPPQVGAVHAIHAHWTISDEPATIVMPTGTGKTETMIAVLVSTPCPRVLVIVPTDALRTQLVNKFLTLGLLRSLDRVLDDSAQFPIVGTLLKKPTTRSTVDSFFEKCHVIITTSHIAGQCVSDLQARIAHHCPYLFIDEAHHAEAPTWQTFKEHFAKRHVLQFTATPFREDGKSLDGKIVYKYPLRKAQNEGYYKAIKFDAVEEFDPDQVDLAIAERAIHHLRSDLTGKHIVMARVGNVPRAEEVFKIYEQFQEFNPVQLHTGIKAKGLRNETREMIINGRSRIVVCVDMLGEGFNLPELKIAAFHDIRKSLAVTLQLAGRFTRSRPDLGDAVFIANTADVNVRDELRKLYTRDPDWNQLLPEYSDAAIEEQVNLKEFVEGFANFTEDIPIQRIRPATSTVIYKTRCPNWTPEKFRLGVPGIDGYARVHFDINHAHRTLVIVTARKEPVVWAHNDQIYDSVWDLLVVFWDDYQHLLFINSSSNQGLFKPLARAVAGEDVEIVNENAVFRTFAGINRLTLQNVGLTEQLGRLIRYTARMGPDIEPGLSEAQKQTTRRTVLQGKGFEDGGRVTVGASRKGRIWSMRRANLEALVNWCRHVGKKVIDENINPAEILKGTLESAAVSSLPDAAPIAVDWPEVVYKESETAFQFAVDGTKAWALWECELTLVDNEEDAEEFRFALTTDEGRILLSLRVFEEKGAKDYQFSVEEGRSVNVRVGSTELPLADFFYDDPPIVWYANGASLEGNSYTPLKVQYPPYPRDKIVNWDWTGVDLRVESQGVEKKINSIQHRVIEKLTTADDYDIVFDDDGAGEAADVVTIRVKDDNNGRSILVEFYHCKYSKRMPGKRIKDLYEVCGQAQKSVQWMTHQDKRTELFTHLLRRNAKRKARHQTSRLEVGDSAKLTAIREMSRTLPVKLSVFVVQPGLSRANATLQQLELISVTENYLMETYQLPFRIIASG